MIKKYSYKGQYITLDIVMKIEKIVRIVSKRTGKTYEKYPLHSPLVHHKYGEEYYHKYGSTYIW